MKQFTIQLSGIKLCTTTVTVDADSSDEAIVLALTQAEGGSVDWSVAESVTDFGVESIDHDDWDDETDEEEEGESN
jgi:hypothetical protein